MDEDKLKHSLAVARKMIEIATKRGLAPEQILDCYIIGFVHEIGSEFCNGNKEKINKISGGLLRHVEFKYWEEVYNHGEFFSEYESEYLDILNEADLQIDEKGNEVGFDAKLAKIKEEYGPKSKEYVQKLVLVKKIRNEL